MMIFVTKYCLLFLAFLCSFTLSAQQINEAVADTSFVNLKDYSKDFVYDMRYATENNFLKEKVYDCAECYLRLKTVKALINANAAFRKLGYTIKIFDCYRPLAIQERMWKIVPNPSYVANPAKGSIHNRGGAVDVGLLDENGIDVDFGTDFDFFGKEAAHDFKQLSSSIRKNRKLLRKVMKKNGFNALASEWWHYNFSGAMGEKVSNFTWDCN